MNPVKVSVVIPVYNTEKYVKDTLSCIMSQSLSELEIIVIDDGSTDYSYQVVKDTASRDDRIRIYRQENKGLSETRNFGISVARGKYIYFMDSDDLLDNNTLAECYKTCEKGDLDFLFFDAEVFGEVKNASNLNLNYRRTHLIEQGIYSGPDLLRTLFNSRGYQASACLSFIRLTYLKKIKLTFYPGIIHEDELFTFILYMHAERIGFINKAFFKRRLRDNSIMGIQFSRKNLTGYFTIADELKNLKKRLNKKALRSLVDLRLYDILNGLLYNARTMQNKDRCYALFHCIFYHLRYISLKNILVLAFPLLKHRIRTK